jgi:phage baseplate assembly protein W
MAYSKSFGLQFPLRDDPTGGGGFLALTKSIGSTVASNLFLLVTTRRGTRWLRPTYGCTQLHRVFEPNDAPELSDIERDVRQSVQEWLPGVTISALTAEQQGKLLLLHIYYEYNEGALRKREVLDIPLG